MSDYRELASGLLRQARDAGADDADCLVLEGSEFSVTVRQGAIETLEQAGSKALGLRVFVGQRTASAHTSDFSAATLREFAARVVEMARATGLDPAAGLPDETPAVRGGEFDLGLHDDSLAGVPTDERIDLARRAESAALALPGITNSMGATFGAGLSAVVLANTRGFVGRYTATSCSLSVVPVAELDGAMERDHWWTAGHGVGDLERAEDVGRIAAERTLRRLGARQAPTGAVPVVFDPDTASDLLGEIFAALSGYAVFRNATFLKDQLREAVASPLVTVIDDGRLPRGLGSRPFDGEGLETRRNVPIENGVLRHFLCDAYAARKLGATPSGCARRGIVGGPSVGASNLWLQPGARSPEQIVAEVDRGLYVTDLIGFGVDLVSGDFSQGAAGLWIEGGKLRHPVHEITIAGNLKQMLQDVDAVGDDLRFRGAVNAPTLRIARMTVGGA